MSDLQDEIRRAEQTSHIKAYSTNALYAEGSWLAKPVKTVLDVLPLFGPVLDFRALDLGCGVGRNAIAVAQYFAGISCRVDCVDILEYAIERLWENAAYFGVTDQIRGVTAAIDEYGIKAEEYDLILAVSALEHVDSDRTFLKKLEQIRGGLRKGGIACLIVNSSVREWDRATGEALPPQFEVNLPTDKLLDILTYVFDGWAVVKRSTVRQKYIIPRGELMTDLETDVVTFVVQRI